MSTVDRFRQLCGVMMFLIRVVVNIVENRAILRMDIGYIYICIHIYTYTHIHLYV